MPELTVVGAINLDLTARVSRAPATGETVADGVLTRQPGGKGANQAAAAARLGADVRLVGAVGDDPEGRDMREALAAAGVDTGSVQTVDERTGTGLIVVDATGENSIVVCPGANAEIDVFGMAVDPRTPVLAQLEVDSAVIEHIAMETDGLVVLNAAPALPVTPRLRERVDVWIVNESEYTQMSGMRDAELVALTLGPQGAVLLSRGAEIARAHMRATDVVSTVGAGDAFAAAFTVGLLEALDAGGAALGSAVAPAASGSILDRLSHDELAAALHRACAVGAAAVADDRSQPDLGTLASYPAEGPGSPTVVPAGDPD